MYDSSTPPSANSSPSSSTKPLHHHHHHHHHMSHLRLHHSSQYSPASRQSDISRLLDPFYASSSSSGSSSGPSSAQTRVYVDQHGDLHDPDYRDFPVVRPTSRSRSKQTNSRRASAGSAHSRSASRGHDRLSYQMGATRPSWERDWSTEIDLEDEDEVDEDDTASQSQFSPFATRRATSPTGHAFSTYAPPHYSRYFGETTHTSSSPVGSYEEESPVSESPFYEDDVDEEVERVKARRASMLVGRTKRGSWGAQKEQAEKEETNDEPQHEQDDNDLDAQSVNVPTCTASIRQQWQVLVLRFRFTVFHTKRRLAAIRRASF